jgi:phosphoadenosine phosphosulfate reductase
MAELEIEPINERLATQSPEEILRWASSDLQPQIVSSSSFQTQSIPLLHMIARACPACRCSSSIPGFIFRRRSRFEDQVVSSLGLNLRVLNCGIARDVHARYGTLYRSDPDLCCCPHKVEPLERALVGQKAWIAGIRRDQTAERRQTPILERRADGLYKISPPLAGPPRTSTATSARMTCQYIR